MPVSPELRLELLGLSVRLLAPAAPIRAALVEQLGAFEVTGDPAAPADLELDLAAYAAAPATAFARAFRAILDHVRGHLVLHAAALEKDGRALLVAGPSGSGKTTLALALARRGYRFLSDDFAPLGLADGLIHPFPKSFGIRAGAAAGLADGLELGRDDWRLKPAPLGLVALFDGREAPPAPADTWRLSVECAGDPAAVAAALAALPGVRPLGDGMFAVDPARAHTAELEAVLAREADRIIEYGAAGYGVPPAGRAPALLPLPRSRALLMLLRDAQNRAGFDPAALSIALGGALAAARCAWLVTGTPEATAALLDAAFSASA